MRTDEIKTLAMLLGEDEGLCLPCQGTGHALTPWSYCSCAACLKTGIKLGPKTLAEIERRKADG